MMWTGIALWSLDFHEASPYLIDSAKNRLPRGKPYFTKRTQHSNYRTTLVPNFSPAPSSGLRFRLPCKGNTEKPGATPPEQVAAFRPTLKGSYQLDRSAR